MLYTPQAPVLDLTGAHVKTKEDIDTTFHALNLCTHEEQKSHGEKGKKSRSVKVSTYQIVILPTITR